MSPLLFCMKLFEHTKGRVKYKNHIQNSLSKDMKSMREQMADVVIHQPSVPALIQILL